MPAGRSLSRTTTPARVPCGCGAAANAVLCSSHPAMMGRMSRPWARNTRNQGASINAFGRGLLCIGIGTGEEGDERARQSAQQLSPLKLPNLLLLACPGLRKPESK